MQIPESEFKPLPGTNPPILYYDLKGAGGGEGGVKNGQRVAVHYDLKFRRITVGTSRQGMGVTGGTPYGFEAGRPAGTPGGPFIKAFNEGIKEGHRRPDSVFIACCSHTLSNTGDRIHRLESVPA